MFYPEERKKRRLRSGIVAGIMLTLLLTSMLTLEFSIHAARAEPVDTTPPTITILEPENKTYNGPIYFEYTIDEPASWTGFSLNGKANETLAFDTLADATIRLILWTELSNGANNIKVYANDTSGNMGSSEVSFTVVLPLLTVEPKTSTASCIGQVLDISIDIDYVFESWELSLVSFRLVYNSTLLEVLGASDGGFMKHFADMYPPVPWGGGYWLTYYFFCDYSDPGYIVFWIFINHPPIWMRVYPEGNGTLATIAFKAIAGRQDQCDLQLKNTKLLGEGPFLDPEAGPEIPHKTEDSYYRILVGDVNGDGNIDIRDIAQAASAFGSYLNHPRWNPIADINQDGRVDIRDIALIAKNFGKTYT